uniref:Macro domain-containing protein n=1 Tax=Gongylonema pulchrum TaxID=637853 RepID=A0A183E3M7_9BILA
LPDESAEFYENEGAGHCGPHFVYGSVTETQRAPSDNCDNALIVHVVDDSGSFGRGGVFDALRVKSQQVVDVYELAGKMGDLHVGDAHLVKNIAEELPITPLRQGSSFRNTGDDDDDDDEPTTSRQHSKWKVSAVLLVAQHYRKRDEISQDVLAKCLRKLASYAIDSGARSIHMPRIGYDKRNISWYAIERLICRILVARGIHTYIYYFNRRASTSAASDITPGKL